MVNYKKREKDKYWRKQMVTEVEEFFNTFVNIALKMKLFFECYYQILKIK